MSWQDRTITIHATYDLDGTIETLTADRFPEEIDVSRALLREVDPRWMRLDGDDLHFTFANGTAHYRRLGPTLDVLPADEGPNIRFARVAAEMH